MVGLLSWAESDIGRKRFNNEDAFFRCDETGLYVVADGMGGHQSGDKASKLAVDSLARSFKSEKHEEGVGFLLLNSLSEAARAVYHAGLSKASLHGMGTTLTALTIHDKIAHICHIGDSRVYLFRQGDLSLVTKDHSLVMEQVDAGIISEEEARVSSFRNIITRAIGHKESIDPDQFEIPTFAGDLFLLCTDGLNNMLKDHEIATILNEGTPKNAVKRLIEMANGRGGDDNVTVILVKVGDCC